MKEMIRRLAFIGIFAFTTVASTLQSANAADSLETVKVTNYGDGIQMTEFSDRSGFEMDGGGARFLFDRKTQTLQMIDASGSKQEVSFSQPQPSLSTETAATTRTTQASEMTSKSVGLVAAAK